MTGNGKQNAFAFYVHTLVYTVVALALRAVMLAPLACLIWLEGWQRWLAVLCPVLAVLVVMPLRSSFAQAMMQSPRRFRWAAAFSFSDYGRKLKEELVHALHVIKWGIPMDALFAGACYCYTTVDALTIFQTINDLGNGCAQVLGLSTANNFMLGIGAVGALLGLGLLVWLWGAARNSTSRYLWAVGLDRAERRTCLKGRRMQQLFVALINLVLWIPFLYATGCALKNAMSDASTLLMMAITTGSLPKTELISAAVPVAVAFAALYLPLVPLRRWNTAAFAMRISRAKADKKVAA